MDKKELIAQSAIKVIAKEGYYNTKVKMIAREADIAVGTVYNYFSNKQEILNYIFALEFDKRIKMLTELKEKEISFRDKLITFLNNHFKDLENNPDTAKVLVQESQLPIKHSLEAIDDFMIRLPEILAQMIDEAKEKEEIRDVDSILIANAIFHAIRGLARKAALDQDYNFPQVKKELINLFWLGLVK